MGKHAVPAQRVAHRIRHGAEVFADAEAIFTYEGTYEVNALIAGRDITGVSAIA